MVASRSSEPVPSRRGSRAASPAEQPPIASLATGSPATPASPSAGQPLRESCDPGSSRLAGAGVWLLLVAVGVAGRLLQPAYNVTPLAAIGLTAAALYGRAGFFGRSGWFGPAAVLGVPAVALAIGNLLLPATEQSYGGFVMASVVFAATLWPALLGLLSASIRRGRPVAWIGGALSHSLVFFLSTNAAYWWLFRDYPHTPAGLGQCFMMALPFFRWMPVGDLAWSLGLLAIVRAVAVRRSASVLHASPLRALRP